MTAPLRMNYQATRRAAFTLVELLVVIGIIAALIAMLLPALNKARIAAANVNCLSNLRQLALGAHAYAAEFGGEIPRDANDSNAGNNPWRSYMVATGTNRYVKDSPHSFGILYARNYLRPAQVFYCPFSFGKGSPNDFEIHWGKVGTGPEDWRTRTDGSSRARAGYMLNPYMIARISAPQKIDRVLRGKQPGLDNLPAPKRILAMDVLHDRSTLFHPQPVWNLALVDGSAASYTNRNVQLLVAGGNVPGNDWPTFDLYVNQIIGLP